MGQFIDELKPRYKKMMESLEKTDNLFTFYIWPSIYSINLIESLNKEVKRRCKNKVVFPNEESLERCLVTISEDYNVKFGNRIYKGFGLCSDTLDSLFA